MSNFLTSLGDLYLRQLDASRRINDALFTGTGKVDRAMLDASHHAIDRQLRYVQAVGATRDFQGLSNLQSDCWVSPPQQLQQLQQEFVRILAEMHHEVGRATQACFVPLFDSWLQAMPPRSQRIPGSSRRAPGNLFSAMMPTRDAATGSMQQFSAKAGAGAPRSTRSASGYSPAGPDDAPDFGSARQPAAGPESATPARRNGTRHGREILDVQDDAVVHSAGVTSVKQSTGPHVGPAGEENLGRVTAATRPAKNRRGEGEGAGPAHRGAGPAPRKAAGKSGK